MTGTNGARIVPAQAPATWAEADRAAFDRRRLTRADRAAMDSGQDALFHVADAPKRPASVPAEMEGQEGLF